MTSPLDALPAGFEIDEPPEGFELDQAEVPPPPEGFDIDPPPEGFELDGGTSTPPERQRRGDRGAEPLPKPPPDLSSPSWAKDRTPPKLVNGTWYMRVKRSGAIVNMDEDSPDFGKPTDDPVILKAFGKTAPTKEARKQIALNEAGQDPGALADLEAGWYSLRQGIEATRFAGATDTLAQEQGDEIHGGLAGFKMPRAMLEEAQGKALTGLAEFTGKAKAIPNAPSVERFNNAKTWGDAWNAFAADPYTVTRSTVLRSAPASMPSVVGGIVGSILGPAGAAAGAGGGSYITELGSALATQLEAKGADLEDPQSVLETWRQFGPEIVKHAQVRSAIVGAFDAATGGLTGKLMAKPAESLLGEMGKEALGIGIQAAGGAGGELAAEVGTGEEIQPGQILGEAVGEVGSGAAEVAGQSAVGAIKTAVGRKGNREDVAPEAGSPEDNLPEGFVIDEPQQEVARETKGDRGRPPVGKAPLAPKRTPQGGTIGVQPETTEPAADRPVADSEPPEGFTLDGTRDNPQAAEDGDIEAARAQVEPNPSDAQIKAENYRHGHVEFPDLPGISMETARGGTRRFKDDATGERSIKMADDYGRFKGTEGADGQPIDVFIGPDAEAKTAFVIDQNNPATGKFDEHKVILRAATEAEAREIYARNYTDRGKDRIGGVTEFTIPELKAWLAKPQKSPVAMAPPKPAAITGEQEKAARAYIDEGGALNAEAMARKLARPKEEAGRLLTHAANKGWIRMTSKGRFLRKPKAGAKPVGLIAFLADAGGIQDQKGEIKALDLHKRLTQHGPLVRPGDGMALDEAREAAVEAEYLPDGATIDDLLQALDREGNREKPVYPRADRGRAAEAEEKAKAKKGQDELETRYSPKERAFIDKHGFDVFEELDRLFSQTEAEWADWSEADLDKAAGHIKDGMEADDALERAAFEFYEDNLPEAEREEVENEVQQGPAQPESKDAEEVSSEGKPEGKAEDARGGEEVREPVKDEPAKEGKAKSIAWADAKPGDLLEDGKSVLVRKGIKTRKEATALAYDETGTVIRDGSEKFAVTKRPKARPRAEYHAEGAQAFEETKPPRVPAEVLTEGGNEAGEAWLSGWHAANLAKPVPGVSTAAHPEEGIKRPETKDEFTQILKDDGRAFGPNGKEYWLDRAKASNGHGYVYKVKEDGVVTTMGGVDSTGAPAWGLEYAAQRAAEDAGFVAPSQPEPIEKAPETTAPPETKFTISFGGSKVGEFTIKAEPQEAAATEEPAAEEEPAPTAEGKDARLAALAKTIVANLDTMQNITADRLQAIADAVMGGTLAEGKYDRKDLYDATELAINLFIEKNRDVELSRPTDSPVVQAQAYARWLANVINRFPTQTVRSQEQIQFQQFSTPPDYGFAVAWAANLGPNDSVIEPSAGTGNILVHALNSPAQAVYGNELSKRRASLLRTLFETVQRSIRWQVFTEDAEQLNNILPAEVKPSVVIMNPPFSQTAGRMGDKKDLMVAARHIETALKRLEPGGRLVAIVGGGTDNQVRKSEGMSLTAPTYQDWWRKMRQAYTVRANILVSGDIYTKFGTSFRTRLLVIDKTGATTGAVLTEPVPGTPIENVPGLIDILGEVRNARQPAQIPGPQPQQPTQPGGAAAVAPGRREPGSPGGTVRPGSGPVGASGGGGAGAAIEPGPAVDTGTSRQPVGAPGTEEDIGMAGPQPAGPDNLDRGGPEPADGGATAAGIDGEQSGAEPSRTDQGDTADIERAEIGAAEADTKPAELTEAVYEQYRPERLKVAGAKPHPGALVQSAAMASVPPPTPSYRPALAKRIIDKGELSDAQLEAVVYAGQAHEKMLPVAEAKEGEPVPVAERRGFFVGDGTGVGKGREIAGIFMDNWNQKRTKGVWISEKRTLIHSAKRDWKGIGGDEAMVFDAGKAAPMTGKLTAERGLAFLTYDTLKQGMEDATRAARGGYARGQKVSTPDGVGTIAAKPTKSEGRDVYRVKFANAPDKSYPANQLQKVGGEESSVANRLDQLVNWLGADFDGVIAFDEAHNMGNAVAVKGDRGVKEASQKALAGLALQSRLPKARVVYVSATGATEIENLAYAKRLGLWGRGTAFASMNDFLNGVGAGGLAALELVARDMKAMGLYISRNLSYDDVEYDRVDHTLTQQQREIYDDLAGAWQSVLQNINAALEITGVVPEAGTRGAPANRQQRSAAYSAFWGAHQRFFNQIITAMQMPSVLSAVKKDIEEGRQAVLQLVNTNESGTERAVTRAQEEGEDLEDLDITPRDQLLEYIKKSFPVQQFEEYTDENGNDRRRPVVDSAGNPVLNPEAVAMRDELIARVASIRVPDSPLDFIMDKLGTDIVAEITGRKRRFVMKRDKEGRMKRTEDKRPGNANVSEMQAFQDGKKKALVFSMAGGTGQSYHADLGSKSKNARRVHYLVQAGWRADAAVQGFGRTHRTNQASAPIFRLVTTDLKGQKRFISSIARRLAQLGALTKGQRQAGDQGAFSARDNLESDDAREALRIFFHRLDRSQIEGINIDEFEAQTGLRLRQEKDGNRSLREDLPPIEQFLNRLLSMKIDAQNNVFEQFEGILNGIIERKAAEGLLDKGLSTVRADKIKKVAEETVYTNEETGAETKHVTLNLSERNHPTPWKFVADARRFVRSVRSGQLYALSDGPTWTNEDGSITPTMRRSGVLTSSIEAANKFDNRNEWETVPKGQAQDAWNEAVKAAPEFHSRDYHIITGAILPIWDRLGKGVPEIVRLQTDDGERLLGRRIGNSEVASVLRNLGVGAQAQAMTPEEAVTAAMDQGKDVALANGWRIVKRRVAGEDRLEIIGPQSYSEGQQLIQDGAFREMIQSKARYFIPVGADAIDVFKRITKYRPVVSVGGEEVAAASEKPKGSLSNVARRQPIEPVPPYRFVITPRQRAEVIDGLQKVAMRILGHRIPLDVVDRINEKKDQGQYNPNSQSIIIALRDALSPFETLGHEAIHALRDLGVITDQEWGILREWAEKNVLPISNIRELYSDLYRQRFDISDTQLEELLIEEAIAEAFGSYVQDGLKGKAPRSILAKIRNFLMAVRNMLRGMGFQTADDIFKAIDSGNMAGRSEDQSARGFELYMRQGTLDQAAPARANTETPAFKRWFGNSKVVDEKGEPLVVYHGTRADFEAFDEAKSARAGAHPSAKLGFFFTEDSSLARDYSIDATYAEKKPGSRVVEAYLSLQNPKEMTFDEWDALLDRSEEKAGDAFIAKLKRQLVADGYDGIIIKDDENPLTAVAFSPTQIKSVFNRGTFDPNDKGILANLQRPGPTTGDPFDVAPTEQARVGLEGLASNINLDYIAAPNDIKQVIADVSEDAAHFIGARRGVISNQQTRELARDLGMTVEDLKKRQHGQAFNAENIFAARVLLVKSATRLRELAAKARKSEKLADLAEFQKVFTRHVAIQEQVAGLAAEAGRALQQFKMMAGDNFYKGAKDLVENAQVNRDKRMFGTKFGRDAILDLAEMVDALDDPSQVNRFSRDAYKATIWDMIREAWINALLSRFRTHATNILSNTLTALWQVPETAIAAAIGALHGGEKVQFAEASARMIGLIEGAQEGLRAGMTAFKTGEPSDVHTRIEAPHRRAIPGIAGEIIRIPTRALMAEDEVFKAVNYRAELNAQATRIAIREGRRGKSLAARIEELKETPTQTMKAAAHKAALYNTFQSELEWVGRWLMQGREHIPGAWIILPFIKTPANIIKYAAERTPFGLAMRQVRDNLKGKNGNVARDTQYARMGLGTAIGLAVAGLVAAGAVSGGGPDDKKEEALLRLRGWQPYSIRIGDTWYSYQRLDPFGFIIGIAADLAELREAWDEADAGKAWAMVQSAIIENLVNKTWLKGLSDFLNAAFDKEGWRQEAYLRNLSGTLIPGAVAQFVEPNDPVLRDARSIVDVLKSRIPGLSSTLLPRRNIFGEEIRREGALGPDLASPIFTSTEKQDKVIDAMLELHYAPSMPRREINGHNLTPELYDEYAELAGKAAKKELDRKVNQSSWDRKDPDDKIKIIRDVFSEARDDARRKMKRKHPELRKKGGP